MLRAISASAGRVGLLLAALLLCSVCVSSQELPSIIVAGPPIDDFKTVYYGARSGLFRRYGLNVTAQPTQSGSAATAAVVGNSAQVAFTSFPGVIQAYVRGVPFRVVAPAQWYLTDSVTDALFVKADSPIRSAKDLAGKIVGVVAINDLFSLTTKAWIDQNGGDSSNVKLTEVPLSAITPALESGRIDAGRLGSPFMEQALAAGKVRLLGKNLDAIGKRYQASVFVSTVDYVAANTDTMRRFVRAMHESIVYTNTHLPETVDLVASFTGVEAAAVARSVRAVDPEYLDPKNLQPVIDFSYKYKLIDKNFNAAEIISSVALKPGER
jgi:NitT/TauT family transport system substrate-binding protein